MDCLGPECAAMLLEWIRSHAAQAQGSSPGALQQGMLFAALPYQEEAPTITRPEELAGALEHLQYAVFRRYHNQLTRAERSRLDNTIDNAFFKIDRYRQRAPAAFDDRSTTELDALRQAIRDSREQLEARSRLARRADLKLAQLASLTAEAFEDFVAELFEMLDFEVERVGGSGDEGADLLLRRADGLRAVAQCKYHKQTVVGSPVLQKFLGTIHHTKSHKGYFVTTTTFSLAAEKFAAENPIELLDGPRLVELIHNALGPKARDREPAWF
jgi:restriction system protein